MDQIPIVHISDLHFDEKIINNHLSWAKGYETHDTLLCHGLAGRVEGLRTVWELDDEDCLRLVVSGDVTARGTAGEFAVAHSYILSHWRMCMLGPVTLAGLNTNEENLALVLGNHDHWDGKKLPPGAYNTRLFGRHAHVPPWQKTWSSTQGGIVLEIFGIESNSGVKSSLGSLAARGNISDEDLDALEALLRERGRERDESGTRRVRAIVMHHSPSYRGGHLARCVLPSVLNKRSVTRLRHIAAKYGVAAILTGHVHEENCQLFQDTIDGQERSVRELRSPTTLQGPAAKSGAGFLAHRLWLNENGAVVWSVWLFSWDGALFAPESESWRPWREFTIE